MPQPCRPAPRPAPRPAVPALVTAVLTLVVTVSPAELAGQSSGAPACSADAYGHFDFWVGEWEVYRPDGTLAGRNTIRKVMGGCVLHESYEGADGGYEGESFNTWDAGRNVWHQTWVDNGGLLLRIEGGLRDDGAMRLEGATVGTDGGETLHRVTWSVIDGDPDGVRQLWETSTDGGATWGVIFDGEYRRTGSGSGG